MGQPQMADPIPVALARLPGSPKAAVAGKSLRSGRPRRSGASNGRSMPSQRQARRPVRWLDRNGSRRAAGHASPVLIVRKLGQCAPRPAAWHYGRADRARTQWLDLPRITGPSGSTAGACASSRPSERMMAWFIANAWARSSGGHGGVQHHASGDDYPSDTEIGFSLIIGSIGWSRSADSTAGSGGSR